MKILGCIPISDPLRETAISQPTIRGQALIREREPVVKMLTDWAGHAFNLVSRGSLRLDLQC
ncbi:hypothetical protein ACVFZR_11315 [Lacticaseibacillus paracasei]